MQVKKGDEVIIIAGKDKGKKGKIAKSLPRENKVIVEGVNVSKRTQRARTATGKGTMVSKPMPIHVSNVKKIS